MEVDQGAGKRLPSCCMPVAQPWFGASTASHHLAALFETGPNSTEISFYWSTVPIPCCFHDARLLVSWMVVAPGTISAHRAERT
jgi:hypothetical protein